MKKNILVLNYEFPPIGGGGSHVSYSICKGYIDNGFNVDVITMGFKGLPFYENRDGINIYRVRCIRTKKEVSYPYEQLTYLISGYFKAKNLLKQKKYSVCHCHFLLPTGILALILRKQFGLKYIITSHGSDVPGHNPDRFIFLHKFTPPLLKRIINSSEITTAPSKYLANLINKNVKGIDREIDIIPNGVDTDYFIPQKKKKIILSTGRLQPLKGIHILAKAFSELNNTYGYELHICGDGPLMEEIQKIKKQSKNKIISHGRLDNEGQEYRNLLGYSMVYCLPSISESGSITLLEAMSSGCAILATNLGVCGEMVEDIGIMIDQNIDSIKKGIEYLIQHERICEKNGQKARIKAIKYYQKRYTTKKFIDIMKNIM